jgi:hypothetical protein
MQKNQAKPARTHKRTLLATVRAAPPGARF